jgi:hypothetical protein
VFISRGPSFQPPLVASASALTDRLGDPLATAATHKLIRTRGTSYDAEIELPASAHTIALRVEPQVDAQPPRYRITLSAIADDDSLQEVGTVSALQPEAPDGYIPVYLNSARLAPGRYQLLISGDAGTSAENDASPFLIRVIDDAP